MYVFTVDPTSSGSAHVLVYELQHSRSRRHGGHLQPDQDTPQTQSPAEPLHAVCQVSRASRFVGHSKEITQKLELTPDLSLILQRTAECSQRQSGHHGEAGDFQRTV